MRSHHSSQLRSPWDKVGHSRSHVERSRLYSRLLTVLPQREQVQVNRTWPG